MTRFAPLALALPLLGGCAAVSVPAHYTSHQLCSAVFVGGQDAETFYRQSVAPEIVPGDRLMTYRIDRTKKEVTADLGGLASSRAVWRGPLGCQVVHDGVTPLAIPAEEPRGPSLLPPIAGDAVVAPTDPALKAALDRAFAEPGSGPHRYTRAIVIVKDGRVIAERYAPGYGIATPQIGWSMTKSVTNALLGILVREGKLDMTAPAPVAAWQGDAHHAITPDNMLRMASGLEFGQSLYSDWQSMFDPSSQMEFDVPDMAAMAEKAPVTHAPGAFFTYSNGNTLLLSRIVREKAGNTPEAFLRFAHRALFDKLGMEHVTFEFDDAGTPIGASHMWATARDWARFGVLFADDGVVGGERILPQGWVDYSARPTPGSGLVGYGAGWWTNRGAGDAARTRVAAGMPADSFMARGTQGQFIIVVPRRKLVIVKLGSAYTRMGDIDAMARLTADTVQAVSP
jgi:hypothetical protein